MPRRTSISARSLKFDISSTTKALQAALCFPALPVSIDYVQTTKEYRGDDTTLRRRHQGKQVSGHKATFESKYLLTDAPEQASFTYKETFRASDSSTPQMARNCAVENEKKAGKRAGFMRWSNALARSLILLLLLTRFPPNWSANACVYLRLCCLFENLSYALRTRDRPYLRAVSLRDACISLTHCSFRHTSPCSFRHSSPWSLLAHAHNSLTAWVSTT